MCAQAKYCMLCQRPICPSSTTKEKILMVDLGAWMLSNVYCICMSVCSIRVFCFTLCVLLECFVAKHGINGCCVSAALARCGKH